MIADRSAPLPDIVYLCDIVSNIERLLLGLIKQGGRGGRGTISLGDLTSELSRLSADLKRCFQQVADLKGRRDLSFRETMELESIDQHCVWLYRKIRLEEVFHRQLALEARLRSLISPEALGVYEELLDAEDEEREALMRGEAAIRTLLLERKQSTD